MSKKAHQDNGRQSRPPDDTDWGEGTKQAHPEYPDLDSPSSGWHKRRTDAEEIRHRFGMPSFELEDYEHPPYPNALVHEGPTEERGTSHVGGTNWLAVGEKGSGKSTLGLFWATRLMEVNDEAVVWRGSSSRSEWLPLKKWTRLFIPANADVEPEWKARDIRADLGGDSPDLDDVVRDVIRYEDPREINEHLEPGTFNVVYPDPSFSGCGEIVAESDYMSQPVEWVPKHDAEEPGDATPLIHWWFAWCIARVEYGPYDWTSLIFDETADLAPQSARADAHETFEKIRALRRVMADSRKFYFSLFFLAHHEENLHSKIRRTMQWRINLADGTANPCTEHNDQPPVGFNQIPMSAPILSSKDIGNCLFWTESRFNHITWDDIYEFPEDDRRWLKISLSAATRARNSDENQAPQGVADDD